MIRLRLCDGQRGFTLIELLIASLILVLVLTVAQMLLFEALVSWQKGEARQEVRENLRRGLDRMSRELRAAQGLTGGCDEGRLVFVNTDGNTVTYYANEERQLVREVDGTTIVVARGISEARFSYHESGRVAIRLRGDAEGTSLELTTSVTLRETTG
ncbi:PilW family protein [Candidatus Desulforudis audaxviator]|uniref:Prepilin-type N-terminal cleavage/methylation domain-containing protein n=1 Tax=Desulforudis audaxviator (strain MP104C) TaxID=477974 RepID=B1I3E0_DESAP|nr:prepilin-type N-terminal cleavage/methylation domain-containing protein [Candidatus Desulforudis audaxviator]ACA59485.1 conserved hypothetical protein [Candidatus Desulforudis audaxviator MP104C]